MVIRLPLPAMRTAGALALALAALLSRCSGAQLPVANCPSLRAGLSSLDTLALADFDALPTVFCDAREGGAGGEGDEQSVVVSALFGSHWSDIRHIARALSESGRRLHTLNLAVFENKQPISGEDFADWPFADSFHMVIDTCEKPMDMDESGIAALAGRLTVLDMGEGCLKDATTLPPYIGRLSQLKKLRLHIECDSFTLTEEAFQTSRPEKLETIYLEGSGNFAMDPGSLATLAGSLKRFSLGPKLKVNGSIFEALNDLENLRKMNLDEIHLKELPPGAMANLTSLEELWLQKNDLSQLQRGSLRGLHSLRELHLELNLLHTIEEGTFKDTPNLEILKIRGNYLADLTNETFAGLAKLKQLDLAYNEFGTIPSGAFRHMANLVQLDLGAKKPAYAQIDSIESGAFDGLHKLEQLNLTSTNISTIDEGTLSPLGSIKVVNISAANIDQLPESFARTVEKLTKLQQFDLSHNVLLCDGNYSEMLDNDVFVTDAEDDLCPESSATPEGTSSKVQRKVTAKPATPQPQPTPQAKTKTDTKPKIPKLKLSTNKKPKMKVDPEAKLKQLIGELLNTSSGAIVVRSEVEKEGGSRAEALLRHAELMTALSEMKVELDDRNWTLSDMCLKVRAPKLSGLLKALVEPVLGKIIPCVIITPLDCFWDGAKPLGPSPPIFIHEGINEFVPGLPTGNLTWRNLDLRSVLGSVGQLVPDLDLGGLSAALGGGYVARQCLDPLDAECPATAPNYFDACAAVEWLVDNGYTQENGTDGGDYGRGLHLVKEEVLPNCKEEKDYYGEYDSLDFGGSGLDVFGRKKRSAIDDLLQGYYDNMDDGDDEPCDESAKPELCRSYSKSLIHQIKQGLLTDILPKNLQPAKPDLSPLTTEGCPSIAKKLFRWRAEYLIDATKGNASPLRTGKSVECVVSAETEAMFQSVVLFANTKDAVERIKKTAKKYKSDSKGVMDVLVALPDEWVKRAQALIDQFKRSSSIDACVSDVSDKQSGEILRMLLARPDLIDRLRPA